MISKYSHLMDEMCSQYFEGLLQVTDGFLDASLREFLLSRGSRIETRPETPDVRMPDAQNEPISNSFGRSNLLYCNACCCERMEYVMLRGSLKGNIEGKKNTGLPAHSDLAGMAKKSVTVSGELLSVSMYPDILIV